MANQEQAHELINFLRGLRAVRHFLPTPIPEEVIVSIAEVVRWSGSAGNQQPWDIVIVSKPETLQALAQVDGYVKHLAGAPLGIVIVMEGDPSKTTHETYDEGRLSERIMLAAAAYGIGSSIGWLLEEGQKAAKELLGIPPNKLVRTIISCGYPDEEARKLRNRPAQARKPLDQIVHREHF